MVQMERSQKTDQENGMVYYVWMAGSGDTKVWKSGKTADSAVLVIFPDFQTLVSQEPHIQT